MPQSLCSADALQQLCHFNLLIGTEHKVELGLTGMTFTDDRDYDLNIVAQEEMSPEVLDLILPVI